MVLTSKSFFEEIEQHFQNKLPFVVFRHPNQTKLTAFLDLETSEKSNEKFIVSPFDSSMYFSIHSHKILDFDYNSKIGTSKADEIEWLDLENKQKEHTDLIRKALSSIQESHLKKVVLATSLQYNDAVNSPLSYFKRILAKYTNTFNYLLFHPDCGVWMGATPERLITMSGHHLQTMALAGTRPYGSNEWGNKEKEEQEFVVREIVNTLKQYTPSGLIKYSDAETIRAGHLEHLRTSLTAELSISPIDAAQALHPTPAVGGVPKEMALDFINRHERLDRFLYSGFLGVVSPDQTSLYVNLRCMSIQDYKATVYVGGGITEKSNPYDEWLEVLQKANTMGRILASEQ
jgi:isochorismate synthase